MAPSPEGVASPHNQVGSSPEGNVTLPFTHAGGNPYRPRQDSNLRPCLGGFLSSEGRGVKQKKDRNKMGTGVSSNNKVDVVTDVTRFDVVNTSGGTACITESNACVTEVTTNISGVTSLTEQSPVLVTELNATKSGITASITKPTVKPIGSTTGLNSTILIQSDGLSLIGTKIGTPMMLDSYTNSMCLESWERSSYARILIEINACNNFSDNMVMVVPNIKGTGYTKETIRVEYEWKPPRCSTCLIFGHSLDDCPKALKRVMNRMDKGKGVSSRVASMKLNLKTIWIGRFHLSANPARFDRPKAPTFQKVKPVSSGNVTGWIKCDYFDTSFSFEADFGVR
nr:hypothetical protein [Tanacetum cinerariifolium]